jgi:metal-responsive CopG/Arc/MetJ family transcriptional regulator
MTVSLPPQMMREVERVRKSERRTRSELMREALRTYFDRKLAEKGRAEMRRGEYYTLDEFFQALDRSRRQARGKGRRARASA